jgi:hypothetical protein
LFILLCSIGATSAAAETVLKTKFMLDRMNPTTRVHFQVPGPGTVILEATGDYPLNQLGLIVRGSDPNAAGLRKDGPTPLRLEFAVTAQDLAKGNGWTAIPTIVGTNGMVYAISAPKGAATGILEVSFSKAPAEKTALQPKAMPKWGAAGAGTGIPSVGTTQAAPVKAAEPAKIVGLPGAKLQGGMIPQKEISVTAAATPKNPSGFTATPATGGDVILKWSPVPNAIYYILQGPGVPPWSSSPNITGTIYTVKGLPAGTNSWGLWAVYRGPSGQPYWGDENNPARVTVVVAPVPKMADRLNPGNELAVMGSIKSQDGRWTLTMQADGNLVLYRSGGRARWATGTYGKTVSRAIMQGDGNFVMYGPDGKYIWDTATDRHPGAWLIVQNDGNVVIYGPAGNPLWATNTNIVRRMVSGFAPRTSGLHFLNKFQKGMPLTTINVLGKQVPIGDASNGMCGGMVFTVRDYFETGIPVPSVTTPPSSGPLFDYLVRRLFDSFNGLSGPGTYMGLMDPALPDHETVASNAGVAPRGRAWIMINNEWPKIKSDLDRGHLSPLGLVLLKSLDPFRMGQNHQVLAYGYELDGTDLALYIYDPNHPDTDGITLSLSLEIGRAHV